MSRPLFKLRVRGFWDYAQKSKLNVVAVYQSAKIMRLEFRAIIMYILDTHETAVLSRVHAFSQLHGIVSRATTLKTKLFLKKGGEIKQHTI